MTVATKNSAIILKDGLLAGSCSCCRTCSGFDPESVTAVEVTLSGDDYYESNYTKCSTFNFGWKTFFQQRCFPASRFNGTYSLSKYTSPSIGARQSWRYFFPADGTLLSGAGQEYVDVKFECVTSPTATLAEIRARPFFKTRTILNMEEEAFECVEPVAATKIPDPQVASATVGLFEQTILNQLTSASLLGSEVTSRHLIQLSQFDPAQLPNIAISRFPLSVISAWQPSSSGVDCFTQPNVEKTFVTSGTVRLQITGLKVFF